MGSFHRTDSQVWWREGEYIPKNSKWLLESLHGVYGTVQSLVWIIEGEEEDTNTTANQTETRDNIIGKVKEMCRAYFELAEQHDRLVGVNHTKLKDFTGFSSKQMKPLSLSDNGESQTEPRMHLLKENEIKDALSQYNALARNFHNVESELSKTKNELAKKEEMVFITEKINCQQKLNLESLQQKVDLQERELKQKREEIERITPRLSEMEMNKISLDNRIGVLEEEIRKLNTEKASNEVRISNLLKDLSLLNETKESLEKEVVRHLRDKENLECDLSSQIKEASEENAMYKKELVKYGIEKEILSEKNSVLESTLSKANIEFEALKEKVFTLEGSVEILSRIINDYLKKKKNIKDVSLSRSKTDPKFSKTQLNRIEGSSQNIIAEKEMIFTQVHLLEEQMKKLNETLEEAESTKQEAESTIATLNINIKQINVQKIYSGVARYDFLIRMQVWKEVNRFLNKMPIWRKVRYQVESIIEGLMERLGTVKCIPAKLCIWLNFFAGRICCLFGPIKYHLVKFVCFVRTILWFYGNFFAAHFLPNQGTSEINISISESKNDPTKIKDRIDAEINEVKEVGQSRTISQLELETQENELKRQELLRMKEASENAREVHLKRQVEAK